MLLVSGLGAAVCEIRQVLAGISMTMLVRFCTARKGLSLLGILPGEAVGGRCIVVRLLVNVRVINGDDQVKHGVLVII